MEILRIVLQPCNSFGNTVSRRNKNEYERKVIGMRRNEGKRNRK